MSTPASPLGAGRAPGEAYPVNWPTSWSYSPGTEAVLGERGMVATTDRYASEVGVDVLRRGGNAVDAAVGVSFALSVVNPEAGNIGGGGFLLARSPDGAVAALDYRSKAPGGATEGMFADSSGEIGVRSTVGHLSAAVPGTVAGLWDAHSRFGSLPWTDLIEPAISLARGFRVHERFVASFPPHVVKALRLFPESARILLPTEEKGLPMPPEIGDIFVQSELAQVLERIQDLGAEGFYTGTTADLIIEEMRQGGGIITHADLEAYGAEWRDPVRFSYRGHTILSMPPPSSGGTTLAETCHILETFSLSDLEWHEPRHLHLLAEAWRRAYADRNHYLADPDFVEVPVETLISAEYGASRARTISDAQVTSSTVVHPGDTQARVPGGDHTTHVSIVDPMGGAVSLTTTLNTWYGSKLVVAGAGFLLNNEMDDFTVALGVPNFFGLVQGEANLIAPHKRMLSAMTPTLVLTPTDDLYLVLGTPGGATIITTVFQVVSNLIDYGMTLAEAVSAPRVHHQHLPDRLAYEPGALSETVVAGLAAVGHETREEGEEWGDVQGILLDSEQSLLGVSDPRRGGAALGF